MYRKQEMRTTETGRLEAGPTMLQQIMELVEGRCRDPSHVPMCDAPGRRARKVRKRELRQARSKYFSISSSVLPFVSGRNSATAQK